MGRAGSHPTRHNSGRPTERKARRATLQSSASPPRKEGPWGGPADTPLATTARDPQSETHVVPSCTLARAPRAERGCHPPPTVDQQSTHKATARQCPAHGVCTNAVAPQHADGTGVSCAASRVAGGQCRRKKSGLPMSGRARPLPCATEDAHHHPGPPTRSRQTAGRSEGAPDEAVCIILKGILTLGT